MPTVEGEVTGNGRAAIEYFYNSIKSKPEANLPLLTFRNGKMGPRVPVWNIHLKSCVHFRTRDCNKGCYAQVGNMANARAVARYLLNYELSMLDSFVDRVNKQIQKKRKALKKRNGITTVRYWYVVRVRIHSVGDFYSNEYFLKWIQIVKDNPKVKFLAYTKNTEIDFNLAPKNLKLKFSIDPSTVNINPTAKYFSITNYEEAYGTKTTHLKPHLEPTYNDDELLGPTCRSKCKDCRFCWNEDSNIVFPLKRKGTLIQLGLIEN